ncbi:major facilitator superfamily MFS_1 [Chthoniobacter flavus Ellin428]|uniref:Major facilitator superfamily MFS_1 n=1 Tax=Chthoniobacter flavus Ellin428 TaxID=497964 RepID=B4D0V8_9BACT|nr:MFS transporter [Chthoniobacter flavus]EDY19970.1 major facilitator superfamily MFS_1 [Chthoniobacter flavus Ellin428]TCO91761.1 putative MFS family arabinose efflux permease [Chthoniobacter flavus]
MTPTKKWYQDVTLYQWMVVLIASVGWVFDAFEGQLFNIQRNQMLAEILHVAPDHPDVRRWGDIFLGAFLVGGSLGGIIFGWLGDRWGRKPTMVLTILFYSIFSGLTYFATSLWHVGILRFFVAMGVGGEWAVAAALVAEAVPQHARAHMSGLFHSTSIIGTWIAAWVGLAFAADWRMAFLVGIAPSLLVLWVRARVEEPERWHAAKVKAASGDTAQLGSFRDLLTNPRWARNALLGMMLAAVGLGTFWAVTVAGQDLAKDFLVRHGVGMAEATRRAKFAYGNVQAIGSGLGMLAFGPLAVRLGRRRTFVLYHVASLIFVPLTCFLPTSYGMLLALLPIYGFFTIGIHAGYAVYFPELFPNHLRSTGTGFCFNGGRLLASPMLYFSGWLKARMDLGPAISLMALLFLFGLVFIAFLPETKGQPLPE